MLEEPRGITSFNGHTAHRHVRHFAPPKLARRRIRLPGLLILDYIRRKHALYSKAYRRAAYGVAPCIFIIDAAGIGASASRCAMMAMRKKRFLSRRFRRYI